MTVARVARCDGMKNPFLSAWLSGANTLLSAARSLGAAEAGRQRAALLRAMMPRPPKPPRPPARRRGTRT